MSATIAVIAKHSSISSLVRKQLAQEIDDIVVFTGMGAGLDWLVDESCDLMLVAADVLATDVDEAIDEVATLAATSPSTQVVIAAPPRTLRRAAAVAAATAVPYVRWPPAAGELAGICERALAAAASYRRGPENLAFDCGRIIGRSPAMQEIYRLIEVAAETDIPVLIRGETGTGKDLVAQSLHEQSGRAKRPYVPVHLGSMPTELVASELFGTEKGAYTGATQARTGKFEEAADGTIFLDEIGTIDHKVQVALLRVIEQRRYSRLGGHRQLTADCRLVAATNADLAAEVTAGRFREDLYYRLDVLQIALPPLRDRGDDVYRLAEAFLHHFRERFGKRIDGMSEAFRKRLATYSWPGNVRELRNAMQRAILLTQSKELGLPDLPTRIGGSHSRRALVTIPVGTPLAAVERELVQKTIAACGGNKAKAARQLGISRRALYNRLARYRQADADSCGQ